LATKIRIKNILGILIFIVLHSIKYNNLNDMNNRTFTMIKPEAVKACNTGSILKIIEENGFKLIALKKVQLTKEKAASFYDIHKDRPFFDELVDYMCSGPIIAAILEKDNAVKDFRKLIGSTDPVEAKNGTIRKLYAVSKSQNAVHGSDSDENAKIESEFHFNDTELF